MVKCGCQALNEQQQKAVILITSQDVILGILMKSNKSGYDIKRMFESLFSYFYNASYGTIYPTLGRMEKEGLITKESIQQEGKPNKNVYSITERGRELFRAYLDSDIQDNEMKSDFMVRMYFGELAEPELVIRWLETGIQKMQVSLAKLLADYERWKPGMSPTQLICIEMGISHEQGTLRNLEEGLSKMKSGT
jgi:DNA-binding PadR family transcriptional regulator